MAKLNTELLALVKQGFVPMPGGMAEPVAGASQMTAGMAAPMGPGGGMPMDPAMAGGGGMPMDPAMMGGGGMPMDPAMAGGGMPMDPAMMGGDPAAMGGDPAMMGGDPAAMGGDPAAAGGAPQGQIVMTPEEFARVLQVVASMGAKGAEGMGGEAGAGKPKKMGTDAKLDAIAQAIGINFDQGQGAAEGA